MAPFDDTPPPSQPTPGAQPPSKAGIGPPDERGKQADPSDAPTLDFHDDSSRREQAVTREPVIVADAVLDFEDPTALGPFRQLRDAEPWALGTIYTAEQPRLQRTVRLIVLAAEHTADASIRDRFLAAARKGAAVDSPHVQGGVYEAGLIDRVAYFCQELDDLAPLDELQTTPWDRRRQWFCPQRHVAEAMEQAAAGLLAIHTAGITHGQLSAASLLRDRSLGIVKLGDLTKLSRDGQRTDSNRDLPSDSWEDAQRHDVRAWGLAFVEILSGVPCAAVAQTAGTTPITLPSSLRQRHPGLSRAVMTTLKRCCEVESTRCWKSTEELYLALQTIRHTHVAVAGWITRLVSLAYDGAIAILVTAALIIGLLLARVTYFEMHGNVPREAFDFAPLLRYRFGIFLGVTSAMQLIWKTSPGRHLVGLSLLDRTGSTPTRWRIALRFVVQWTIVGLLVWLTHWLDLVVLPLAIMILYLTAFVCPCWRPIHDWISGVTWSMQWTENAQHATTVSHGVRTPSPAVIATEEAAPHRAPLDRSTQVGPYTLDRRLGEGGMGEVYLAFDNTLHRRVAVKVISPKQMRGVESIHRFEREARLAAQIHHANVAKVLGAGTDGAPFIAFEFLSGRNLAQVIADREGPLTIAEAWDCILQAAHGLAAAHELGIVHRDVKPANLMWTEKGAVKVMDFGLSKLAEDHDEPPEIAAAERGQLTGEMSLTRTGAVMGTPQYASPEQATGGRQVDCRSDIYSLGLTLHFLLVGEHPIKGQSVADMVLQQCTYHPPTLTRTVGLSRAQQQVLDRMIAKSPDQRFPNYAELIAALDATRPLRPEFATVVTRVLAECINLLVVNIPKFSLLLGQNLLSTTAQNDNALLLTVLQQLAIVVIGLSYIVGIGRWGVTPGKWLLGLRVVRLDGSLLGYLRATLRWLALYPFYLVAWIPWLGHLDRGRPLLPAAEILEAWLVAITIILGFVSFLLLQFSATHQGLHDRLSDSIVLQGHSPSKRRRA